MWCWIVFHFRFPHFHKQLGWRTVRKCTQNRTKKLSHQVWIEVSRRILKQMQCWRSWKKSYFLQSIINNQGQKEDSSFSFPCNSIGILMTLYYNSRCYGVIIHGLIIDSCISGITFSRFKEVWCKSKKEDQPYK